MNYKAIISKILFYCVVLVAPLVLWFWGGGKIMVTDFVSFLNSTARAAGIVGITFFAGNLLLSGRYRWMDRAFGGLDKVYLFHRRTGIVTFILLCYHAAVMTFSPLLFSLQFFIASLATYTDLTLDAGRLSFIGLFVIVLLTLYIGKRMNYERLRFLHRWLGGFLFLGGLHAYFIPSDISYMMPLRWFTLGLVIIALLSYLFRTILAKWFASRIECEVVAVNDLGGSVTEIVMKPKGDRPVEFDPGQFIFVRFKQPGFPYEDHPFSLTASLAEGERSQLRISAKGVGDFTRMLPQLKTGAKAFVQGPYGGFSFKNASCKKQIWIAGGIGITPFMSATRTFRDKAGSPELADYDITLFYSAQTPADLVYGKELEEISKMVPQLKVVNWIAEKSGFLTIDYVESHAGIADSDIFICGPGPMLVAMNDNLREKGILPQHIHFELFTLFY